jgi:hypothetical protein
MTDLLTPEEVARITKPLTQPAAQSRWLTSQGITHSRAPDGSIIVTWWQINNPHNHRAQTEEPNWKAARA